MNHPHFTLSIVARNELVCPACKEAQSKGTPIAIQHVKEDGRIKMASVSCIACAGKALAEVHELAQAKAFAAGEPS